MRAKHALLGLAVTAVLFPGPAVSGERSWSLAYLMAEMAKRPGGTVRFVEERHFKLLTEPLIVKGTLSFEGNRLEKHNLEPEEERVVIDGQRVTVMSASRERPGNVYLSDFPALDVFVSGLRATLRGDLGRLRNRFWIKYDHEGDAWRMTLTPLDGEASGVVREVKMSGKAVRMDTVDVIEASGDRSSIRLLHE